MEAKDLVSRVKHARGYFPVVGVGAFDGFQTITPRGSRQAGAGKGASTGMNSQTSKGRGRGLGKEKLPRDSRRPSPAKSRVTSTGAAKGGPAHGTRIQAGQCLLCRQMGRLARDCPNRGTRDDSGIKHKRSFVGMTADGDSTAGSCAILGFHHVSRVRFNLAVFFWSLWNSSFFIGVIGLRCQVQNMIVLLGLRQNQSQFHLLLQHSNVHLGQC